MKTNLNLDTELSALGVKTIFGARRLICQISDKYMEKVKKRSFRLSEPTIGDVLDIDLEKHFQFNLHGRYLGPAFLRQKKATETLHKIRAKLIELGFDKDQSKFIYFGTKKYYMDKVEKNSSYLITNSNDLSVIVNSAENMGWIQVLKG